MANHCFKLYDLTEVEMAYAKDRLDFFCRQGVKMTFLKKVAFIHLDETQRYTCIFCILSFFKHRGKLKASTDNMAWAIHNYIAF